MSLFSSDEKLPLAEMLRPKFLRDVIGQEHLLGENKPIARMLASGSLTSFVLWGPPGVGKTTIARLVASGSRSDFIQLSAVMSGVADLRKVFEKARANRDMNLRTTVFVDELHRFNRSTQDAFLPHVESGLITLIGATTENPSFSLVGALLSRLRVFTLEPLDQEALGKLLRRVEEHLGRSLPLTSDARHALLNMADGDGRYLVGLVETLIDSSRSEVIDQQDLAELLQKRVPLYDKAQDGHYNLLSCFHKSLRGSDADAALYWAARMVQGGEDINTLFRRLACAASEDVGLADPQALQQVITAWSAFERVGWPEGRLFLAQAIVYVATCPKSNAAHIAFDQALALAKRTGSISPPKHILNAPTKLMEELGYNDGYKYDHDFPDAYSGQGFLPESLGEEPMDFYKPNERGFEREITKRLQYWRRLKAERVSNT